MPKPEDNQTKPLVNEKPDQPKPIDEMSEAQLRKALTDSRDEVTRANKTLTRSLEDTKSLNIQIDRMRENTEHVQQENLKLAEELESVKEQNSTLKSQLSGVAESATAPTNPTSELRGSVTAKEVFLAMVTGTLGTTWQGTNDADVITKARHLHGMSHVFASTFNNPKVGK